MRRRALERPSVTSSGPHLGPEEEGQRTQVFRSSRRKKKNRLTSYDRKRHGGARTKGWGATRATHPTLQTTHHAHFTSRIGLSRPPSRACSLRALGFGEALLVAYFRRCTSGLLVAAFAETLYPDTPVAPGRCLLGPGGCRGI